MSPLAERLDMSTRYPTKSKESVSSLTAPVMTESCKNSRAVDVLTGRRVLVTGATGFTGSRLAEKLCDQRAEVVAIHRRDNIPGNLRGKAISWVKGDVYDPEVTKQACRGVEYIFHVAAAYREAGIADEVYTRVHVDSTRLLAQEALRQSCFRRFIHVSTVGVHGHIDGEPVDESAPFHPGDIYQSTKAEAEVWIREFAAMNGLELTVVRPTAIFGPGDLRLLKLFRMAKLPVVPLIGFGKGYYHLIHVADLVDCLMLVATHSQAAGEVFICGNTEPVRLKNMVRAIAGQLGRHPRFVHLPAWPFFAAAHVCERVCSLIGVAPPLYPRRVAFFTKDRAFDTGKLQRKLEFQFRYDNARGLRQTCDWYVENRWL